MDKPGACQEREMNNGIRTVDTSEEVLESANLNDLPLEVLSSVMSRVNDVMDLGSLLCTCHQFRFLARVVPFNIKLCHSKYLPSSRVWTRAVLKSIRSHMPSTRVLDLSATWIADDDVAAVLADLKCLECLILDGCQKLTSFVADALAVSVRSGPRTLSLQRCFGIGPAAAGNLLAAAAVNGSRLQCILFSHLDRLDIPRDTPLLNMEGKCKEATEGPDLHKLNMSFFAGAGLHILALNNCASLGLFELLAVATTCPLLEILMLGGSVEGLGLSRSENLSQERLLTAASALNKATEYLGRLHVLEITFFNSTVVQSVREEVRKDIEVWDFCHKSSVMAAASYLNGCQSKASMGSEWHELYCQSENIMKDLSFGLSNIWGSTRERCSYQGRDSCTKFCQDEKGKSKLCREDVVFALRAAANCSDVRRRTPLHVAAASGDYLTVGSLLTIGAEVKGMKDSGGATALFVAAECGYANVCELLLQGGADVLVCNRAGENPLYIAALRGHCAAVEVLVSHCCKNDINWQSAEAYGDGWTPLMAAAVADRQEVAKILLKAANINPSSHLDENTFNESAICSLKDKRSRIDRDNSDTIGFYTATMCRILQEYQPTCGKSQNITERKQQIGNHIQLLDAQNRYGQTALHIAARRASIWFVCNLLIAGASMEICDGYMMRAIDVAYHHKHKVVANVIKNWDAIQRSRQQFAIQQPLFEIQEGLRSKDEQSEKDVSDSPSGWQSNKNRSATLEVLRAKQNDLVLSSKLTEANGRSIVTRRCWRVKGGQKRAIPHAESSSGP
eukprot:Gb_07417 [translate_table: standard]